jgi:hypothetical protein
VREDPARGSLLDVRGLDPPLTAERRARLAVAAQELDAEITARLAAGPCSKPARPTMVDLHMIPVNERSMITLTVEETVGSCERKLAFLVFVESAGGFSQPRSAGVSGRDPLKTQIDTLPRKVPVTYTRVTGLLTVGTHVVDPAKANIVVLSAGPKGVEVRYQGKLDLTFERHGRPSVVTGMSILDYQPEIALAVRGLVDKTPELRALVRGAPGTTDHP